jgi:hypothetical protein
MTDNVPHWQSQEPRQRASQRKLEENTKQISDVGKRRHKRRPIA